MITGKHVEIYKSYGGDIDGFSRFKKHSEHIMTEDIWFQISGLIQNLAIIKNGHGSENFISQTLQQMNSSCDEEGKQALIDLSKQSNEFPY